MGVTDCLGCKFPNLTAPLGLESVPAEGTGVGLGSSVEDSEWQPVLWMLHENRRRKAQGTWILGPGFSDLLSCFIHVSEPYLCCSVKEIDRQRVPEEQMRVKLLTDQGGASCLWPLPQRQK